MHVLVTGGAGYVGSHAAKQLAASGHDVLIVDNLAEHTARGWEDYADSALTHFEEMKRILDDEDPSYAE